MKYKDFVDKHVYIVGGSEGIGLETAKLFAAMGAHVIIFSRTREKLERALKEIENKRISPKQKCSFKELDVVDPILVKTVLEKAVLEFGTPDIFINNAGRAYPHYFEDVTYEQFEQTMRVNLFGMRNTIAVILPYMKAKGGTIVNVSSMAGLMGVFGYTDYSASKFAIVGFSEALRREVRWHNINVNILCPPDTNTPGFKVENTTKPLETQAISETAKVRTPEFVARALIKGIKKNKPIILPGFDSYMVYLAKRLFPWLAEYVMDATTKKVQKKKNTPNTDKK